MNILFLVENLENQTALNLVNELNKTGNNIDIVPYFSNKKNQCSIRKTNQKQYLKYKTHSYFPDNYDAVLLWCWGTASTGRKYLKVFEDQGVHVLNSTYKTEITDSKILFANALREAKIASPKTLCFDKNSSLENLNIVKQLGHPPYVFKPDYGTQGFEVRFAFSEQDVQRFAKNLQKTNPKNPGFIVQEFIGDPKIVISHYRVLVIGENVLPAAIKISAKNVLNVSNIAAGGIAELVPIHNELKKVALLATKTSGLNIAGVDIMVKPRGKKEDIVVLEVNDGPGTKTFDKKGFNASKAVIDFFIDAIEPKEKPVKIQAYR